MLAGAIAPHAIVADSVAFLFERAAVLVEPFARRTLIGVAGAVVLKVGAREGAIASAGFVEDRNMRLDPLIIDKPAQHLGIAIAGVANKPLGV